MTDTQAQTRGEAVLLRPNTDLSFDDDDRYVATKILDWLFFNSNRYACAIVAVQGDAGDDWAAYINGCDSYREEEAIVWVAKHGCKLSEQMARAIFAARGKVEGLRWRP